MTNVGAHASVIYFKYDLFVYKCIEYLQCWFKKRTNISGFISPTSIYLECVFTISMFTILNCSLPYSTLILFLLQVAIIDVNESLGKELKVTLNQEYGPDRTEFYTADVTSEEQFKGVL